MRTVIKQIVGGSGDSQTIRMVVKDSERGAEGPQGIPGEAATVTAGQAYSLPAGSNPYVENTGTSSAAVFDFYIPKGDKGDSGTAASVAVGATTTLPAGYPAMVQNSGTSSDAVLNFSIPQGEKGDNGKAASVDVGSTTTLGPGQPASVTNSGTSLAAILDFAIPRGEKGETGATGAPGKDGVDGKDGVIQYTAGTGITISGTTIAADIEPADYFTADETVTGTGSTLTLNNTMNAKLDDTQLLGDTAQQTYSGKNVVNFATISYEGANDGSATRSGSAFTVTGNSSDQWGGILFRQSELNLKANTTYTFSAKVDSTTAADGSAVYIAPNLSSSGQINGNLAKSGQTSTATFTTPSTIDSSANLRLYPRAANAVAVFTDIQIETGSSPTSYEPYVGGIPSPNPDYPQDVNVVTGTQTVAITDGNDQSRTYTIDLGSIELCKIGAYQDKIYKSGDDWYVHKEAKRLNLAIADMNNDESYPGWKNLTAVKADLGIASGSTGNAGRLDYYTPYYTNIKGYVTKNSQTTSEAFIAVNMNSNNAILYLQQGVYGLTQSQWKSQYPDLIMCLYYTLATPTDTQITDATLVGQLDALNDAMSYDEQTNFAVAATSTNLPAILGITAFRKSLDGTIGAINNVESSAATITMTSSDPGEGVPLSANNFIAVYEPE